MRMSHESGLRCLADCPLHKLIASKILKDEAVVRPEAEGNVLGWEVGSQ